MLRAAPDRRSPRRNWSGARCGNDVRFLALVWMCFGWRLFFATPDTAVHRAETDVLLPRPITFGPNLNAEFDTKNPRKSANRPARSPRLAILIRTPPETSSANLTASTTVHEHVDAIVTLIVTYGPSLDGVDSGGEGGIRTLGTLLGYGALAKRCFRPLSHLTHCAVEVARISGPFHARQPS